MLITNNLIVRIGHQSVTNIFINLKYLKWEGYIKSMHFEVRLYISVKSTIALFINVLVHSIKFD